MKRVRPLLPLLASALLPVAASANYLGILKLPRSMMSAPDTGVYSFASSVPAPFLAGNAADAAYEFKLGYKYSRFFAVEGEFNDFNRTQDLFSNPSAAPSALHGNGFGIDTVATVPWRGFSFYGKFGAYHGDAPSTLSPYATSLLGERGTRLRYGLGMRYNITRSFGVEAQMQHYSPLGAPLSASDPESDLFSVGVKWRF
jgi:hypothetical protein